MATVVFKVMKTKLFGTAAARVTTEEMRLIFEEIKRKIDFPIELVRSLPSKLDHGDIDLIAATAINLKKTLPELLGGRLLQYSKNSYIHSILYRSELGKDVHVDFIVASTPERYETKRHYYALNDFSSVIGVIAKNRYFKYGSEGFFKRFLHCSIWYDIFITHNLMEGLAILGYENAQERFEAIQNNDDIINFALSSPLFDSRHFEPNLMRAADRQATRKRTNAKLIMETLLSLGQSAKIEDDDYFLKQFNFYEQVEQQKKVILETRNRPKPEFGGHWLMQEFGLKPGPQIGRILNELGKKLQGGETSEEVKKLVEDLL